MRKLTRLSIALLLTLFLAAGLSAQTAPPSGNGPGPQGKGAMRHRGFDGMAQQLNLTDAQKTQVQNIFQTQRQQAQSIRQDTSLTPQQRQDKLQQLRESTHQQIMGVLTPEQQQKWQQLPHRRGRMGGPGGGPMGPMAGLNLTEDQKAKIQPIMQSSRQQAEAVRADSSLTPEQRHARLRDIHQNTMSQIQALLTPEQQQQLQQRRNRGGRGWKHGPPPSGF